MRNANELEFVAGELRRVAQQYTNAATTLQDQVTRLNGAASNLTAGGFGSWIGQGSLAFLGACSRYQQDSQRCSNVLGQSAASLTSMSQTIEDNLPAIRAAQSMQQSPHMQQQDPQLYQQAMQQAQMAEFMLAMMAASMSAQLEEMSSQVGTCSVPDNISPFDGVYMNNDGSGDPGVPPGDGEGEAGSANTLPPTTEESVIQKLIRYLLNPDHPDGGSKANWFRRALGFTRGNAADLAKQIVFDESSAVETGVTPYGTKYNQVIRIVGANGKKIDVLFAWIRNDDGVVRLVTAIPPK